MKLAGRAIALAAIALPHLASADGPPTFNRDIAPIVYSHCVRCHRQGDIASVAPFTSYAAIRPWAKAIREKVILREMPPWPADPAASLKFRNDARLNQRDIDKLVAWIDAGAPQGTGESPAPPAFTEGWLHPQGLKPDLVISMPGDFEIPATGEIPYIRFLIKVPVPTDKWITASQIRAGNPAVVHHMAITEVEKPHSDPDAVETLARQLGFAGSVSETKPAVTAPSNPALFDMLGVYTPGSTFEMYGEGTAKLLKGGPDEYLNFNVHYTSTGKPETDRSVIGLWFRDEPPRHQLFRVPGAGDTILANGVELLPSNQGVKAEGTNVAIPPIPPNDANYQIVGITGFPEPVTIYQFQPHGHLRAKDFKYVVVYPDGREESVLSVPRYDFRWQLSYDLETPLKLPAGSKMIVTAHYDNSPNNKFNPAPDKEVYFRDQNQSWDEMFTPFIQYTIDQSDRPASAAEAVGCLSENPASGWTVGSYRLIGAGVFDPSLHKGQKVFVKGLAVGDANGYRLNVTSLRTIARSCPE